jgi:hypothetical protein
LQREALDPRLCQEPIGPRPASAYQSLLVPKEPCDEASSPETPQDQADPDGDPAEPA